MLSRLIEWKYFRSRNRPCSLDDLNLRRVQFRYGGRFDAVVSFMSHNNVAHFVTAKWWRVKWSLLRVIYAATKLFIRWDSSCWNCVDYCKVILNPKVKNILKNILEDSSNFSQFNFHFQRWHTIPIEQDFNIFFHLIGLLLWFFFCSKKQQLNFAVQLACLVATIESVGTMSKFQRNSSSCHSDSISRTRYKLIMLQLLEWTPLLPLLDDRR